MKKSTTLKPCEKDLGLLVPKCKTIGISLTRKQQIIVNDWIAATRKVWNKSLHYINSNRTEKHSEISVRNKFVIKKQMSNKTIEEMEWTLRTPKRIREYGVRDLFSCINSCKTSYEKRIKLNSRRKGKKPRKPKINAKSKDDYQQTICLPKESSKIFSEVRNGKTISVLRVCSEDILLQERVQTEGKISCNMRLTRVGFNYFISLPVFDELKQVKKEQENTITAIDPGYNIPLTYYDPSGEYGFIGAGLKGKLNSINIKIKYIEQFCTKNKKKAIKKQQLKKINLVDDFQWKVCHWLLKKYNTILIPSLYVSNCSKESKQIQHDIRHCTFVNRLIYKSIYYENTEIHHCKEHYTSMTCTNCGSLNTIKDKVVRCLDCSFVIHRDLSGGRNILIKHLK